MATRFYIELGSLLKEYRIGHSLTQQDVADRLRVSRSTISSWESGRRIIYADDLFKYCDVLNVDPNEVCNKVRKYLYKD